MMGPMSSTITVHAPYDQSEIGTERHTKLETSKEPSHTRIPRCGKIPCLLGAVPNPRLHRRT